MLGDHQTHSEAQLLKYYTSPTIVRQVLRFLAPDYRHLQLPVPTWAVALAGADQRLTRMHAFSQHLHATALACHAALASTLTFALTTQLIHALCTCMRYRSGLCELAGSGW